MHGSHLPAPLPVCVLVCWLCVCRVSAVGVSACRRVGVSACVCSGGNRPIPDIPVFLEKVIIYRGPPPHTSCTFTWYDGFFAGGFWSFFSFFRDMTRAPARPNLKPAWTPALKPRLAAAPKAEDTARPAWPVSFPPGLARFFPPGLGGRATWVVGLAPWSCNLGGRATWVVVQPGWSCNLGGRVRPRLKRSPVNLGGRATWVVV